MCHECPECGQVCYCDGDDTFMESGEADCVMGHGVQYGCVEADGSDLRHDDEGDYGDCGCGDQDCAECRDRSTPEAEDRVA